jgi:hypothetical protein
MNAGESLRTGAFAAFDGLSRLSLQPTTEDQGSCTEHENRHQDDSPFGERRYAARSANAVLGRA